MKTIISVLLLSATALSSATFANDNHYFYLGADGGIFKADFDNSYIDQTDPIQQNFQQTVTQHGYTGGVLLGYRSAIRSQYFIGGEISSNWNSSDALYQEGASSAAFSDKTQINSHMDFAVVPGLKISQTITAFMKLGLSVAWMQDNLTSPAYPTGLYTPVTTYYSNKKTETGFVAGLGVSKTVCKHMDLFASADYHDYGTVNFQSFQNFSAAYTHASKVFSYDVLAGAAYRFV